MSRNTTMAAAAVAGLLALGALGGNAAMAAGKKFEKCYGVAKAGKNDCQTATSDCAGTSTADGQADAYIFVPKGTCEKIVGGSSKPAS